MDYIKLYQYYQSSILTDLEVTLNDGINNLQLKVHKLILSLSVPFFEKQFAFSIENKIILNVDNAFVANDLIMSFYGQTTNYGNLENWFHLLKTFQLRDYLGLENDATLLINLEVPAIGFELLLKVCELVGFDNECIKTINKNLPNDYDCFKLSKDLLNEMIWSENYCKIISGNGDHNVKIWNSKTGELIKNLTGNTSSIKSVAISFNDKLIASGCIDGNIIIWDVDTGVLIHKLTSHNNYVLCVSFSPTDKLILSGNGDKTIKVWNVSDGKLINTLTGHDNSVQSVIFSPDNQFIVSGGTDTIQIWNAKNYQLIQTIRDHINLKQSIAISLDNKRIISGSNYKSIKIWNLQNGKFIASFIALDTIIRSFDISSNNDKIISSSFDNDNEIKIWDANDYHLIHTLNTHTYGVNRVKFSSDAKFIISVSDHNFIKIWDAVNYQLISTIKTNSSINIVTNSNKFGTALSKKLKKYL